MRTRAYPRPTEPEPNDDTIEEWLLWDGDCEATDGCRTDPDGWCEHGHPSWLLRLGLI